MTASRLRDKALALILLAGILIAANALAARFTSQLDLTQQRFFTLSEATRDMLGRIETPVQVELYFSTSRPGLPIGLKVFAQRVEQLLRQYERRGRGKVEVKILDPVPGSPEEEEAQRLGLTAQPIGNEERLFFGLAVFHGGNRRTIPLIDYRRERLLEYDISRLIQAVQVHRLPKLAVASSLHVFGRRGTPKEQQRSEDGTAEWQFIKDLRVSYDLVEVHPTFDTLPPDTDALLVIDPVGFDPRLLYAIDQFILSGRPAVILVDPFCYIEVSRDESDGPVIGEEYDKASDLPELFQAWGLRFSAHEVVADAEFTTDVPVQEGQPPVAFPLWISIPRFDDTQPVTAGFDSVMLAHAGFLAAADPALQLTPLLQSSAHSAPLPGDTVGRMNPYRIRENLRPTGEVYTMAALVEGHLHSAFPGGRPPAPKNGGSAGWADQWSLGLKESKDRSRLVVVADADFLGDAMSYEAVGRRGGTTVTRPRNNNVAFLANALDLLRGRHDMLPIRAKGQTIRPFVRVHDLRHQAEASFRQEFQAINGRLEQIEAELPELHRQAAQGGGALVSEKALTAIRRVEKERKGLRARRTAIEQQLQQRISGLYRRLTVVNLALVPSLIAALGTLFWLRRTRRMPAR
jgi:ABC-type uncharacterized transport system involved in gliding motility auxiliary subunit